MVSQLGTGGIALLLVLLCATLGIALLCYVWMKSTRASQKRMDDHFEAMVRLLEEQNTLLRRLSDGGTIH